MEPLRDTAGNPLPAGANPAIHWNMLISRYGCSSCFPALEAAMKPLRDTAGNPCQLEPTLPNNGTLISTYGLSSCFPALEATMEPLRDTVGNPLPAGANPAIHWNTYLQVQLFFLLSCLGGTHGTPAGHCREPPASQGLPHNPLEHLSPGTVALLAFLPWRRPWKLCGTLQGTPCQPEPTPPSTGTLMSM